MDKGAWKATVIGLQRVGHYWSDLAHKHMKCKTYTTFGLCASDSKESACSVGDLGSIPGLGRPRPGEGKVYPFQHSGLENSMDCIVHGVIESDRTEWLSLQWKKNRGLLYHVSLYFQTLYFIIKMFEGLLGKEAKTCLRKGRSLNLMNELNVIFLGAEDPRS